MIHSLVEQAGSSSSLLGMLRYKTSFVCLFLSCLNRLSFLKRLSVGKLFNMGERTLQRKVLFLGLIAIATTGVWYSLQPKRTMASEFSLTSIDGKVFRLSDFRGKIVVINFMTTSCGSCSLQIPELETVWEEYDGRIVIMTIDISIRQTEDTLRAYAQKFPDAKWIWALDKAELAETYKITAIPTTIVIDERGYVNFSHVGITAASTLIHDIGHLMS